MKRTIFMPTDLSQTSLDLIEKTLADAGSGEIVIVLTICMFLSDSITELLFFDKNELIASLRPEKFKQGLQILSNKYSSVKAKFQWEVFTGLNQAAFNNFILGNQINEAIVPKKYFPLTNSARNFDPTCYLRKSPLKVTAYPAQFAFCLVV